MMCNKEEEVISARTEKRTENMQAYVDDLERRIEIHGKGQNGQDRRMSFMVKVVENPGWLTCTDEQSIKFWRQFAQEQSEYGREAVAEINEKAPHLLTDETTDISRICKVFMGGWEYGERFLQLLQSLA